jgi:hypothetical protein
VTLAAPPAPGPRWPSEADLAGDPSAVTARVTWRRVLRSRGRINYRLPGRADHLGQIHVWPRLDQQESIDGVQEHVVKPVAEDQLVVGDAFGRVREIPDLVVLGVEMYFNT